MLRGSRRRRAAMVAGITISATLLLTVGFAQAATALGGGVVTQDDDPNCPYFSCTYTPYPDPPPPLPPIHPPPPALDPTPTSTEDPGDPGGGGNPPESPPRPELTRRNAERVPGGPWSAWTSLGGIVYGTPSAAVNANGTVVVFGRGIDNGVYFNQQQTAGGVVRRLGPRARTELLPPRLGGQEPGRPGGAVRAGARLGGRRGAAAVRLPRLAGLAQRPLVGVGQAGQQQSIFVLRPPTTSVNAAGLIEVYAFQVGGNDHGVWRIVQCADGPVLPARHADGRVHLFTRTTRGSVTGFPGAGIYHSWQTSPGGTFTNWVPLGDVEDTRSWSLQAAAASTSGRVEVFAYDGVVVRQARDAPAAPTVDCRTGVR